MNHYTFKSKEKRNERASKLKLEGFQIKKRSTGPCQLHPEYIEDWTEPFTKGFGNTDYMTFHKNLFIVEYTR